METTVQITEVESRQGQGRNNKPYTLFKVKASDGNSYDTFKAPLGKTAAGLRGQTVVLEFDVRQNGEYTNYDLIDLKPAGSPTASDEGTNITSDSRGFTGLSVVSQRLAQGQSDKDAQINRSVAFKGVVELVGNGVLTIDGVSDLNRLTDELATIVGGTYAVADPFEGLDERVDRRADDAAADEASLVDF